MQLSGIIFDMDGVLIDSEPVHKLAKERTFARFGITLPDSVYENYKGRPDEIMMNEIVRSVSNKNLDPKELVRIKHEEFEAIEHLAVPISGAKEFVLWAHGRYPIALATSATPRNRRAALSLLGLEDAFDFMVDSSGYARPKPDPEVFEKATQGLKLSPKECMVIEDSLNGVLAAKSAGCVVAAVTTSFPKSELVRSGADFVAQDFVQLQIILGSHTGH
jgi:beta-phosphoglucomutase